MQSVAFGTVAGFVVAVIGAMLESAVVAVPGVLLFGACLIVNIFNQDAS